MQDNVYCEGSPGSCDKCRTAPDLFPKPTDLSHRPACRLLVNYIHHRHLLLLNPKPDTQFTIPQRVED